MHKAIIVYPPMRRTNTTPKRWASVFLAGSIEMGKAERWQDVAEDYLMDITGVIYNPRRPNWDSSWAQSIDHPEFNGQVNWELDNIEEADYILFVFDPNTQSPITLMELGYALAKKPETLFVCCPEGFWRKGNVDIMCERACVKVFETVNDTLEAMGKVLRNKYNSDMQMPNSIDNHNKLIEQNRQDRLERQGK